MSGVKTVSRTQRIIVNSPQTSISVINEGPQGPGGPAGVDGGMTGEVRMWAASAIPSGWLDCDGAAVARASYSALFIAIGVTWGPGDGVNTFNVPDMRGKAPIGVGTGTGLTARALAAIVGSESHALAPGEIAVKGHAHAFSGTAAQPTAAPNDNVSNAPNDNTSDGPSNNTSGTPSDNTSNDNAGQDHTHSLSNHQHYEQHYHGLGGHTHSGTTADGGFHAHGVIPGGPLTTAIQQVGGLLGGTVNDGSTTGAGTHGHTFGTGGPSSTSDWATRDYTDGPNTNTSGGISATHTHGMKSHTHGLSSHTHTMKNHTHAMKSHTHTITATGTITGTTADGANGAAHNNMQPSIALKFIIKT